MLTEVVKKNNDKFLSVEDTYIMNPAADYFGNPSEPMEVIIKCPHKRKKISALTNAGINISATANWKEIFQGSSFTGLIRQAMGEITAPLSWMKGQSVMQPWMNRKMWESTSPFQVTIPLSFVCTQGDAKGEVYDPCMALLSFAYPREYGNQANGEKGDATSALNTTEGLLGKVSDLFTAKGWSNLAAGATDYQQNIGESVLGAALNSFKLYNIPGPSLDVADKNQGDPVSIMIGPAFNLGSVYLKDVKIDMSKTLDPTGYPLAANVTLTVEPANACYCNVEGDLVIFDAWENNTDVMNELITSLKEGAQVVVENVKSIVQNFISIFPATADAITGKS